LEGRKRQDDTFAAHIIQTVKRFAFIQPPQGPFNISTEFSFKLGFLFIKIFLPEIRDFSRVFVYKCQGPSSFDSAHSSLIFLETFGNSFFFDMPLICIKLCLEVTC
jgi:hypothetical protein